MVKPQKSTEAQRWQRTHEQKLKIEARQQEQASKAEALQREQAVKAEQAKERARVKAASTESAREHQRVERLEKEQIEKQAKLWDAPLTHEEAVRYEKISEERALYMKKQKEAQAAAARSQQSDCVITPVMTEAQLARCR